MSGSIRIFIDEVAIDAIPDTTVLAALTAHDPELAGRLARGGYLTDGVGRRLEPDAPVRAGLIVRIVAAANRPDTGE